MDKRWITWWSRAQRGMGHLTSTQEGNKISLKISELPAFDKISFKFANFYGTESINIDSLKLYSMEDKKEKIIKEDISFLVESNSIYRVSPIDYNYQEESKLLCIEYEIAPRNAVKSVMSIHDIHFDDDSYGICIKNMDGSKDQILPGLVAIEIYTDAFLETVVAFGDSITEGSAWYPKAKEILKKYKLNLVNQGIGGNRLLRDISKISFPENNIDLKKVPKELQFFGEAGIKRFERDTFKVNENVKSVLIAIGINDLYQPGSSFANIEEIPSLDAMKEGYLKLAKICERYKSTPVFVTLTPFWGAKDVDDTKENLRKEINQWFRSKDFPYAYIDFELLTGEKNHDGKYVLKEKLDSGDHLHPSEAMGEVLKEKELIDTILGV